MSFKCTPEKFAELIEEDGIVPAPYVARYHWVALERFNAVSAKELKALLRTAYDLVLEKLPKRARASLGVTLKKSPSKRR
jgi:predicted DNA-binding protein (MmcQ/YjbR family)